MLGAAISVSSPACTNAGWATETTLGMTTGWQAVTRLSTKLKSIPIKNLLRVIFNLLWLELVMHH
jgi:hypothetical protein